MTQLQKVTLNMMHKKNRRLPQTPKYKESEDQKVGVVSGSKKQDAISSAANEKVLPLGRQIYLVRGVICRMAEGLCCRR